MDISEADFGVVIDSSYILSRRGYQQLLFEEAEKRSVQFRFSSPAESVEDNAMRPVLILKNGNRIEADLIVGADGKYYRRTLTVQYIFKSGLVPQWKADSHTLH
jgi:2-polyprenyl-6-methoxyphenol hydroxylase-like FAD-dependent oxidoreductase